MLSLFYTAIYCLNNTWSRSELKNLDPHSEFVKYMNPTPTAH